MQSIGLVLCFAHTSPPVAAPLADLDAARVAFDRVYLPFLATLDAYPAIRPTVHFAGALLDWMADFAPDALRALVAAVAAGRVEVVGGLWGGGLFPALPERDAVGQVQATLRWWKSRTDQRLRGAWLPYGGWDPSAARVLGRLGLQYTFLEEAQFHPPVQPDGYFVTEREGQGLALFVSDTRLSQAVPHLTAAQVVQQLALRAKEGRRCVTITLTAESLGVADEAEARRALGPDGWLPALFRELSANAHWIKLVNAGTVIDRMRPTDRAWPPPSVNLPLAIAALGGDRASEFEEIVAELRSKAPDLVRCAPFLRAGSWDGQLLHFPEINRLHKRMLRASIEVLRLRTLVREGKGDRDPRFLALEEATLSLYRGQVGAAYVMGADVGSQDGALRNEAWAALIRAERLVALTLGEVDRVRHEQVDYDCDGRAEVIVRTPHFCGIVAPAVGGALVELDVWALPGNLLNVRSRRPEAEHREVIRAENLPLLPTTPKAEPEVDDTVSELEVDVRELPPLRFAQRGLADHVHHDKHVRASFIDHFFGPEATLENVRRARYPEVGDFLGSDYQLLKAEDTSDRGVMIAMARDGSVNEGAALRLVRILKKIVFHGDLPVIDVRYELSNRYHEPVRARFGVEVNLNLDGASGEGMGLLVGGERYPLSASGEHADTTEATLFDARRSWRATLSTPQPGHLWRYPIETVSRSPRGMVRCFQGTSLVLWWPVELWGLEKRRFDLSLMVEA